MSKNLRTQYEFLFIGRDEGGFVENYAYDLGEGGENSGKIFVNLNIEQNAFDAEKVGEIIFDNMRRVFFADLDIDPYERFEEALKEVNKALSVYKGERDNEFLGQLNVILAAVVNDTVYLTQTGEAEAYLIRKRFLTTISEGLDEGNDREVFTNIASGAIENNDFLLFSTTRLLRYIAKTDLIKLISGRLDETMSSLKTELQAEVLNKIGLVGIHSSAGKQGLQDTASAGVVTYHEKEESYKDVSEQDLQDQRAIPGKLNPSLTGKQIKAKANEYYQRIKKSVTDLSSRKSMQRFETGSEGGFNLMNLGKEKILLAIIALIIILTAGVWWLRAKEQQDQKVVDLSNQLIEVQQQIDSAITTGQFDKERAGEILINAESLAIEVYNTDYHNEKAGILLDKIMETRDSLDGVIRPETQMIANLADKRDNVDALGMLRLNDELFAYEYNALYPVVGDKVSDPLTIDDNEQVIVGINYDDRDSILFFTDSDKVIEYADDRMNFLSTSDETFKDGVAINAYSNKIYLLDPEGNQLWRYTRTRDRFDAAEAYAVGADLSNAIDLAIDGNIYILHDDGYITRLFRGNKEDFPIKNQPVKEVVKPTKIYTEPEMDQIYVLEPNENRVLIYLKDDRTGGAVYTGQYIFDELQNLKDLVVDVDTNTLYLLTNNAIHRTML